MIQKLGRSVAFANQKGGVTKTSTLVNVSAALSELGQRVVVFDLDVNCGSTRLFGVPEGLNIYGTYEVMKGEEDVRDVIVNPGDLEGVRLPDNVSLIPAHVKLEGIEAALREKHGPFVQTHQSLVEPIQTLRTLFDWVLLDTAPSMTPGTLAAYMSADSFILTAVPEPLAIEGLVNAVRYIKHAQDGGNTSLELMGVVMNQVPGKETKLSRAILAQVDSIFGEPGSTAKSRYKTAINASTVVPTLQEAGLSLFEAEPKHKVTQQYRELAKELVARFDEHERPIGEGSGRATIVDEVRETTNG